VPDCSLFSHGWLPSQLTDSAERALEELGQPPMKLFAPSVLYTEYSSTLRKFVARRQLSPSFAQTSFNALLSFRIEIVPTDETLIRRAWEIAVDLGQSDTFDALGYATAEAYDAEFWTCDRRFANAAGGRGCPRLHFVLRIQGWTDVVSWWQTSMVGDTGDPTLGLCRQIHQLPRLRAALHVYCWRAGVLRE
jgi:predicted nucleic acid-binding protein